MAAMPEPQQPNNGVDVTPEGKRKRAQSPCQAPGTEAKTARVGYGKAMSSPWELPPGGIEGSPAWQFLLQRCGGAQPPAPEERLGAPIEDGFPVSEWPPNVLVDCERVCWLPDSWGQGVKNTGPGGTYIVWVSPKGGIFYHRPTIEKSFGRELTPFDSSRGRMRSVQAHLGPSMDEDFLRDVLTAEERQHIVPANGFRFCVISARRARTPQGAHDIMVVEAQFKRMGVRPTWYVDAASCEDYRRLGLDAVVGGKLTPARNMALDDAQREGKPCVQVSDDISKWEYVLREKLEMKGGDFSEANAAVAAAKRYSLSPVAAAQLLLAKMRASGLGPRLGGVYPTANAAQGISQDECTYRHFILGDFFVADDSPCRFDSTMTLKEDYDLTASHLARHGAVLRCNRLFLHVKHSTNEGGAVATRDSDGSEERKNIAILQTKWPGAFSLNGKRKDEVIFNWSRYRPGAAGAANAARGEAAAAPKPPAKAPREGARGQQHGKPCAADISGEECKAMLARALREASFIDVV